MGFLDRAIKKGISEGVGKAVGDAISKTIEPKANELANQAAQKMNQAADNAANQMNTQTAQKPQGLSNLENAFANLEKAVQGYVTKLSENIKVCPSCGRPCEAAQEFCPECGAELPKETIAQSAVCSNCQKQNPLGTKFCQDCGTKLPIVVQEEQAAAQKNEAVMAEWDAKLGAYPKWNCGGTGFYIEDDGGYYRFGAEFKNNSAAAQNAVVQYQQILMQNGFAPAGQYPSQEHLYKMINGTCYHVDLEHCFDGGSESPVIYFNIGEPTGGYHYVKPEPKKTAGLKDLFKF